MSADSPRRTVRGVPAVVPPQVVSDPSIIDSVAGFINDVTLTNQPQLDPKDTITWARFEQQADISDPHSGDEDWELEGCAPPPLILILGYGIGIQVWAIPANGEAVEVLSWRHGNITAFRVLPTPTTTDVHFDRFSDKRALMALCEEPAGNSGPQYSTVNFVSLKDGSTVKSIKFKNTVLDILTNKSFVIITFPERIAVFDARSLDDHLSITTCYPSPGINPNPVALGHRWLAYSENKLIHTKRSQGGCEVEGVPSYTATMLNAAKSLGKGLKELGETVAAGLKGSGTSSGSSSKPGSFDSVSGDTKQAGVITIFDIKNPIKDISPTSGTPISVTGDDPIIAHFVAHSDAIVAMEFDPSGMLLLTADKRGHDFHVFKIFNHAMISNLSAVHHLYILHRGDTTAKVQNIAFSPDSRWVAVSTLRGTTHVFPITPYGGAAGVRTHTNPHVVNRLSRFHRSAGLSPDGRSSSPILSHSDSIQYNPICMPYNNAMIPPFPKPIIVNPLAKLRQPSVLGSPPGSAQNSYSRSSNHGRQRLSSLSDDTGKPLSVCAVFAKARSWLLEGPKLARDPHKVQQKVVDSLFIMAGHGALIQYDLDVKAAQNVAKDKICDESPIELDVEAKAQWNLSRKDNSVEIQPPLLSDNWLMKNRNKSVGSGGSISPQIDDWVSQVEIMTHAGPGRRLWMGPQCVFKTYNTPSGSSLNHIDTEAVEVPINVGTSRPGRSSPMNMPLSNSERSTVPFVIESGSYSSIEQSPRLIEKFCHNNLNSEYDLTQGESRLKEDLADAMRDLPSGQHKDTGLITPRIRNSSLISTTMIATSLASNQNYYIPGGVISDTITTTTTATPTDIQSCVVSSSTMVEHLDIKNILSQPMITGGAGTTTTTKASTTTLHQPTSLQPAKSVVLIEKVVNPQGTVTTITRSPNDNEYDPNDPYAWLETDYVIHENFDEALFRPVVTIFCDNKQITNDEDMKKLTEFEFIPPEPIKTDLVIPVIEEGHHSEVEFEKPPESIGTELHVPVVITEEKLKMKRKNEKIEGNSMRSGGTGSGTGNNNNNSSNTTISGKKKIMKEENVDEQHSSNTIIELPASINKKTKSNKKGNNSSIMKEKSPSPKVEVESKESINQLSYENENYRGSIKGGNIACANNITENPNKENANDENPRRNNENIFEDNSNITTKSTVAVAAAGTKTKKSDIKEVNISEKSIPTKSNGKQRKTSKVEFITEDIVSSTTTATTKPIEDPSNKSKSEKMSKTLKVSIQSENESKKMPRVSSDTGIIKSRKLLGEALMNDKELASSCVELVGRNSINKQKVEVHFDGLKKSEIQKIERDNDDENDDDDGLQFYDKFASESPKSLGGRGENKNRKMISTAASSSTDDHIQINVEFPSLSETFIDNKKTKKQKGPSPNNSSIQISSNTTTTTTVKESKKTSGNFGCDSTKLSDDDAITEIVTITLPPNRRKQKKNIGDDNSGKKCKSEKCSPQLIDKVDSITIECSNEEKSNKKGKNGGSSNSKIKDITKLPSTENALKPIEFSDDTFLPPLSSLEPFDSNFDNFHFKDSVTGDDDSLINLDSPPQDLLLSTNSKNNKILSNTTKLLVESTDSVDVVKPLHSGYENLIFALCGSLHYETAPEGDGGKGEGEGDNNDNKTTINTSIGVTIKKYSKESQRKRFSENDDEQYLSLEPQYAETTSSSSDADIDESTCVRKKSRQKLIDDDEELRPLISGANSACSMTSSTSGKKEDDTPSIALEIAKAIVDTLPDNSSNQSDSSDQANISESEIPDTRRKISSNDDDDGGTSSVVRSANIVGSSPGNNGGQQHKMSSTSAQLDLISGGGGGNGNGGSGSGNLHQNGKKKLKKKKR